MRYLNWFRRSPHVEIKTVSFPLVRGLTLAIWRQKPDLIGWVANLWNEPNFQGWLDVLRNEAPQGYPPRDGNAVDPIRAAVELGRKEGYQDCLNVMLLTTTAAPLPSPEISADYLPPQPVED